MQDLFVDKPGYIEVTTTVSDKDSAQKIADHLIGSKLAACVQVLENVSSTYRWKGKIEKAEECIIFIKTKMNIYGKLAAELKKIHPYELPEIVAKQIIEGSTQYLNWIEENTIE